MIHLSVSVGPVAEETQPFFLIFDQMIRVVGPHRFVTGYTGHYLAGPGIKHIRADGMRKCSLGFMAFRAYLNTVTLQKSQVAASVGFVAINAVFYIRMLEWTFFEGINGYLMAGTAYCFQWPPEVPPVVSGMGRMTVYTAVSGLPRKVVMG